MAVRKRKGFIFKNMLRGAKYPLVEVEDPKLFRDVFPYHEMVRVTFDHKIESIDPPDEIFVTDTTFQGRAAVEASLHRRADRQPFRLSPQVERPQRRDKAV